jgi:hypothetical protein
MNVTRDRKVRDLILVKNETGEQYNRCLVMTGSDFFLVTLGKKAIVQAQKNYLQEIQN